MSANHDSRSPEVKPSFMTEAGQAFVRGAIRGRRSGMTEGLLNGGRVTRAIIGKVLGFSTSAKYGSDEYVCAVINKTLERTFSPESARKLGSSLHEEIADANADIADRGCGMVVVAIDDSACTFACRKAECTVKTDLLS